MKDMHYFISDVTSYPVTFAEPDDNGLQLAQGIPVIRPGKYKGQTYTAADLQQMAKNFDTIRDRDGFTPSLTPRHWAEVDEVLGPITALRWDEERSGLVADAMVDEVTVGKIQTGKYRYISAEIDFDYELQTEKRESIGPALEGAAFVLTPAVRGMQIDAVLNAHEFPQLFEEAIAVDSKSIDELNSNITQLTQALTGGDANMTILEKVKAFVTRASEGEEIPEEELTALAAEVEPEETKEEEVVTLDTDGISRQMQELEKSNTELRGELTTLNQLRMRDQCQAQVDELVRGGHVPPAQRQEVYLMLEKLSGDATKLIVLGKDAEGEETTSEQTPVEVYVNTLKGMGLAEKTPEHLSGGTFEETVLDKESEAAALAMGERIVEAIPKDQRKV